MKGYLKYKDVNIDENNGLILNDRDGYIVKTKKHDNSNCNKYVQLFLN